MPCWRDLVTHACRGENTLSSESWAKTEDRISGTNPTAPGDLLQTGPLQHVKLDEQIYAPSIFNIPSFHSSIRASLPPLLSSGVKDTELRVPQCSAWLPYRESGGGLVLPSALLHSHSFMNVTSICGSPWNLQTLSRELGEREQRGMSEGLIRERTSDSFHPYPSDHPQTSRVDDTSSWLLLSVSVFVFGVFAQSQCHGSDISESGNGVSLRLSQDIVPFLSRSVF